MNKEQLAELLNGREYGDEITREEAMIAKSSNLAAIYGASDDLLEFDGAISDEVGAYGGTEVYITPKGLMSHWNPDGNYTEEEAQHHFELKSLPQVEVRAIWCKEDGQVLRSWTIETDVPHATFEIMEDGEVFCQGLVLDLNEVFASVPR